MTLAAAAPSRVEAAGVPRARQMLERARWAARAFATYDHASVMRIAEAVTRVAEDRAEHYARWAVRETGFGVVADKTVKNRLCSRGTLDAYRDHDYVTPRMDTARRTVELPRPVGVVLALTPSTNPVSTLYLKVIVSLLARNAVVVSPHPSATQCCRDAARVLAETAVAAGAPDGVVQVVEEPSIPVVDALMTDERTDVILATGGVGVVRAAYSSGNPAMGVGPGNVPVLVDATADVARGGGEARGEQGVRQLAALHQRERPDRGGRRRRPDAAGDGAARGPRPSGRRAGPGPRHPLPRGTLRHIADRQGRRQHRGPGGRAGRPSHPHPGRAVRSRRRRGTARPREALPRPRRDAGAHGTAGHPYGGRGAAHRRRRGLGRHPQQRPRHRDGVRSRRRRAPSDRQRRWQLAG